MANPAQFAKRIRRIALGVVDGGARSVRNSAIGVIQAVTRATPVLTRFAQSNWVANIGSPDLSERPIRPRTEVIEEARGRLSLEKIRKAIFASDEVEIHIANGGDKVPYLGKLDRGSSTKAPAGFVGEALRTGASGPLSKTRLLRIKGSGAVGF